MSETMNWDKNEHLTTIGQAIDWLIAHPGEMLVDSDGDLWRIDWFEDEVQFCRANGTEWVRHITCPNRNHLATGTEAGEVGDVSTGTGLGANLTAPES